MKSVLIYIYTYMHNLLGSFIYYLYTYAIYTTYTCYLSYILYPGMFMCLEMTSSSQKFMQKNGDFTQELNQSKVSGICLCLNTGSS